MARIRPEQKEKVRRRLLEAAAEDFAENGLQGAAIDRISLAAGLAKGTVYNYFESKEQLFAEVLAEGCRRAVARYASVPHRPALRDSLRALAEADLSVLRSEERFMKIVVREAMSFRPESYPLIVSHLAPFVEQVDAILARGVVEKQIRSDRPTVQLSLLFVGLLVLLYVQHWGSGGVWPVLEEIPDLAVSAFLDGAGRSAPP